MSQELNEKTNSVADGPVVAGQLHRRRNIALIVLAALLIALAVGGYFLSKSRTGPGGAAGKAGLHVVTVFLRTEVYENTRELTFDDERLVASAVEELTDGAEVVSRLQIPVGIADSEGTPRFLNSLSGDGASLLGAALAEGGAVGAGLVDELVLEVPEITVSDDGGMTGGEAERLVLPASPFAGKVPLELLDEYARDRVFLGEAAFSSVLKLTAGQTLDELRAGSERASTVLGYAPIQAIYVVLEDRTDVKKVEKTLEESGFDVYDG